MTVVRCFRASEAKLPEASSKYEDIIGAEDGVSGTDDDLSHVKRPCKRRHVSKSWE